MLKKILFVILLFNIILMTLNESIDNTYYVNLEDNECCLEKIEDKSKLFHHYNKIKCDDKKLQQQPIDTSDLSSYQLLQH